MTNFIPDAHKHRLKNSEALIYLNELGMSELKEKVNQEKVWVYLDGFREMEIDLLDAYILFSYLTEEADELVPALWEQHSESTIKDIVMTVGESKIATSDFILLKDGPVNFKAKIRKTIENVKQFLERQ